MTNTIPPYEDHYPIPNIKEERKQFKEKLIKVAKSSKKLSAKDKAMEEPLSNTQYRKLIRYEKELEKSKFSKSEQETKLNNQELKTYIKHK